MAETIEALELRPRQQWAVHRLFEAMRAGYKRILLVMPTGAGKRFIAVHLCQRAQEKARKVLFVTNRRLLVKQMFDETARFGVDHGVVMADTDPGNAAAHIQIASIQTLESWYLRPGLGAKHGVGLPEADLVIIDEGHQDVDRYVALLANYPQAFVVILTATPVGAEGRSLIPPYDTLIEGCLNSELIGDGLLLPTMVYAPSEPDIQGVKIVNRQEYNQGQLGRAVKECTVFADVFNEWSAFADRRTVCFVPGVAFGHDLVEQFNRRLGSGQAWMISAKTKHDDRERIIGAVENGEAKILVSVDVLREGFDLPVLSCGVDLQPNSQLRTYWQKLGRIKRAAEGQSEAVWLDFAGNYWRFPHPDEDPEWPQGEETTQDVIERRRKPPGEPKPIMCVKCSFVRRGGPKCPQCGHMASGDPVRRIRMGNGKLKEIPARAKAKREKTQLERDLDTWKGVLFSGLRSGRSLASCGGWYKHKTGDWPRDGWPGVVEPGSLAGKRLVKDALTAREIMVKCSEVLKGKA